MNIALTPTIRGNRNGERGSMAPNDRMALDSNFNRWTQTRGAGLTGLNLFNYYCGEHFLKLYPINDKELRSGLFDASKDGGTDAFYFFANRKFVDESPELDPDIDYRVNIIIFQFKESSGFSPIEIGKFIFFAEDLLDINRSEDSYKSLYNDKLKRSMRTFKEQFKRIAGSVSKLTIEFFYVTRLDVFEPTPDDEVSIYAGRLKNTVKQHFQNAEFSINFINAAKLHAQVVTRKPESKNITYASQNITPKEGWIGLVSLSEYYNFISDSHGEFYEEILEDNVRGFQRKTPVNDQISETLADPDGSAEFWLLNNGITILSNKITPAGMNSIVVKDPQIVNGLQTSRSIYNYFKSIGGPNPEEKRRVLVRVIESTNESVRDQIIRATNSQKKMPLEALRATDAVHRRIEEIFLNSGYYYDRRKGFYKDQNKPAAKIVSVREVLQGILAISLRRPDEARARPMDYLKEDRKYDEVFGDNVFDLGIYLSVCPQTC